MAIRKDWTGEIITNPRGTEFECVRYACHEGRYAIWLWRNLETGAEFTASARKVKHGQPAHAAAKRWGLAVSTIYRSAEYRAWKGLGPYNRWKPAED